MAEKLRENRDQPGMKVGILGGSFDPIHLGHLQLAQWAVEKLDLKKVLFIPAATPPHKQNIDLTPEYHRLEMVRLAIQEFPNFQVSDIEIKRKGVSYTIDTIRELKKILYLSGEDLYLIIGADNLLTFYSWREPEKILEECQVVAFRRPGFNLKNLNQNLRRKVKIIDAPLIDISSTEIRKILKNGGSADKLVPEPVWNYIQQNHLYRN